MTCDIKNNKIIWNKVKHIQLRKEKPGGMFVKCDFSQEFMEIECTPNTRGKPFNELPRKYNRKLAIPIAKKEDFLSLCKSNVIPSDYRSFYENIPVECTKRDCLPESDVNEDDKYSDLD